MAAVHADVAALNYAVFSQDVENALEVEETQMEEKNTVQLLAPCSCTKEDFVVFAEFSEVTGPMPLLTIPSKLSTYDVDMNTLIMKIMSADYQSNPSGQFSVSQDVQVLQHDVLPGRHAYVHYCSLNDLRARGFVRPLCVAYISADHKKLHDNYDNLRKKFLVAVEMLHYNNRQTFIDELTKVLANLKQIQNQYFLYKKKEEDGECLTPDEHRVMDHTELDQLAHQYTELQNMLLAAEPLQGNEELESELKDWSQTLELSPEEECRKYILRANKTCIPTASAASLGPASLREPLRSVPALSPWGSAAMLWHLLCIQRSQNTCRLHTVLSLFPAEVIQEEQDIHSPSEALADSQYLQLLLSSSVSFQWPNNDASPTHSSPPVEALAQESLEYLEANLVTSGNEASSSYHSAPESLSELTFAVHREGSPNLEDRTPSMESFLDVLSESDSCDEPFPDDDDGVVLSVWAFCPWKCDIPVGNNVAGKKILRFFQLYAHKAQHIVFSLLMGRTVVLSGSASSRKKIRKFLVALSALVPVSPPSVLWWHQGILVSSHVSSYQLIGMCVPERLSVHDMISPRDKNLVTILDVTSSHLWGPAYSGNLLQSLDSIPAAVFSDQTLLLLLRSIGDGLQEKLFILKSFDASLSDTLLCMGLKGCDADILKHLMNTNFNTEEHNRN